MKRDNFLVGRMGETEAEKYLRKKRFLIVERNFRTRFGEIDIVCYDGETLVFVEVKAKKGHNFGEPEEMMDDRKLGRVRRMAEVYVQEKNIEALCRIDMVAVVFGEGGLVEDIRHYQAVY